MIFPCSDVVPPPALSLLLLLSVLLDRQRLQPRVRERRPVLARRAWTYCYCVDHITGAPIRIDEHEESCSVNAFPHRSPRDDHMVPYLLQEPLPAGFRQISIAGSAQCPSIHLEFLRTLFLLPASCFFFKAILFFLGSNGSLFLSRMAGQSPRFFLCLSSLFTEESSTRMAGSDDEGYPRTNSGAQPEPQGVPVECLRSSGVQGRRRRRQRRRPVRDEPPRPHARAHKARVPEEHARSQPVRRVLAALLQRSRWTRSPLNTLPPPLLLLRLYC